MLLIKAKSNYPVDGTWDIFEAHSDLRFLGTHHIIEVPVVVDGESSDGTKWYGLKLDKEVYGLPYAEVTHVTCMKDLNAEDPPPSKHFVRWASWRDEFGESYRLITDGPIFICNDEGSTVEAIR